MTAAVLTFRGIVRAVLVVFFHPDSLPEDGFHCALSFLSLALWMSLLLHLMLCFVWLRQGLCQVCRFGRDRDWEEHRNQGEVEQFFSCRVFTDVYARVLVLVSEEQFQCSGSAFSSW